MSAPTNDELLALVGEFDADKWAQMFVRLNIRSDIDMMRAWFANAIMSGYDHAQKERRSLVRALDVALNGEAGAAPQASLCDILAQIERQQSVQIVNMSDGMRINFRAPDGRRATLHIEAVLNDPGAGPDHVLATMRAAVDAYPVAGAPLPVRELHSDTHDAAQVQALAGSQVDPSMALPHIKGSM